jgi:gamma-glutamyltranspeptidase/glutathione hydrolase
MTQGLITAPQPEAVEAGADVLREGGNAVDAAVACALVQTAVDPLMSGIAGFGSMQVYMPGKQVHRFIDFHGRAPAATRPDMWQDIILGEADDGFGFILEGAVNELGYQSITTPMTLRALETALARFGTRSLADLIQPAIAYAEEGFQVRPHVNAFWNEVPSAGRIAHREYLARNPGARQIYCKPDGSIYRLGEVVRNPDMGRTYRRIAEHGVDDFYTGAIAAEIAADMAANGGLLAAEDLAAVTAAEAEPLWGSYRGHRVATNNPPGGGVMLLEMLNILEKRGDEDRHRGQGYQGRRSALLRRAGGRTDLEGLRGGHGRPHPPGREDPCDPAERGRRGIEGHHPCLRRRWRGQLCLADPFHRHARGRRHAGAGLHV